MNYTLLQYPERLVLVSDEEINIDGSNLNLGDYYIEHTQVNPDMYEIWQKDHDTNSIENSKRVIAGHGDLPSLDVSAVADTIGWVDVEKLAVESIGALSMSSLATGAFVKGFRKSQELNKNKFTYEDIVEAMRVAVNITMDNTHQAPLNQVRWDTDKMVSDCIAYAKNRTQQPKQWSVEIEMEFIVGPPDQSIDQPRITNNTIKVVKVI